VLPKGEVVSRGMPRAPKEEDKREVDEEEEGARTAEGIFRAAVAQRDARQERGVQA